MLKDIKDYGLQSQEVDLELSITGSKKKCNIKTALPISANFIKNQALKDFEINSNIEFRVVQYGNIIDGGNFTLVA